MGGGRRGGREGCEGGRVALTPPGAGKEEVGVAEIGTSRQWMRALQWNAEGEGRGRGGE